MEETFLVCRKIFCIKTCPFLLLTGLSATADLTTPLSETAGCRGSRLIPARAKDLKVSCSSWEKSDQARKMIEIDWSSGLQTGWMDQATGTPLPYAVWTEICYSARQDKVVLATL